MTTTDKLTLGYIEKHPRSAALVLEELAPADAVSLLEDIPSRISGPVFDSAAPWAVAGWFELLSPARSAAIIPHMSFQDATTALRLTDEAARETVLSELPTGKARSIKRSLRYPEGTVGAWMDHSAPTFDENATVADGLKYFKARRRVTSPYLIVVDSKKEYAGMVSAHDLLKSINSAVLSDLMDATIRPLRNRSLLVSVMDLPDWDHYPVLPVVGRKGNVLGMAARRILKSGLGEIVRSQEFTQVNSIAPQMISSFFAVAFGIFALLTNNQEASPRSWTQEQ